MSLVYNYYESRTQVGDTNTYSYVCKLCKEHNILDKDGSVATILSPKGNTSNLKKHFKCDKKGHKAVLDALNAGSAFSMVTPSSPVPLPSTPTSSASAQIQIFANKKRNLDTDSPNFESIGDSSRFAGNSDFQEAQKIMSTRLCIMLEECSLPTSLVEHPDFRDFMHYMAPTFTMPTALQMMNDFDM
jgi:hypothetical protein